MSPQKKKTVSGKKRQCRVWWANHGMTFAKAREGGFLWTPMPVKGGNTFPHWESMTRVGVGDIVLNYARGNVAAIGIVRGTAKKFKEEAKSRNVPGKDGWRVDLDFYDLKRPVELESIKPYIDIINRTIEENHPFNNFQGVNNGYLFDFSLEGLKIFAGQFGTRIPEKVLKYLESVFESDFISFLRRDGLVYDEESIRQYITAIHSGAPVILSGQPGTGKTGLALKYAKYIAVRTAEAVEQKEDTALLKRRWFKLSYNDKDIINAFEGAGRRIDQVRNAMLSDNLVPVGWETRDLNQKKMIKALNIGDVVIAYEGAYTIGGIGIVTHQHFFDDSGDAYDTFCESSKNFIRVDWIFAGPLKIKDFSFKEYNIPGFGMWVDTIHLMTSDQVWEFNEYLKTKLINLSATDQFIPPKSFEVIPVQADWRTKKNLLGDYDNRAREYYPTKTLTHILNAKKTADAGFDIPFFLIFDEMNLADIDQYFADFLSALDSGEAILLHDSEIVEQRDMIPKELVIPRNLFIVGTINTDNNSWALSQKVLDRSAIVTLMPIPVRDYLEVVRQRAFGKDMPFPSFTNMKRMKAADIMERMLSVTCSAGETGTVIDKAVNNIEAIQSVFDSHGRAISPRAIITILKYLYTAWVLDGQPKAWNEWTKILDDQILQRLLPRISGDKEDLDPFLKALYSCCFTGKSEAETKALSAGKYIDALCEKDMNVAMFSKSAASILKMQQRLEKNGFASFFEKN